MLRKGTSSVAVLIATSVLLNAQHTARDFGRIPRSIPSDSRHLDLLAEQTASAKLDTPVIRRLIGLLPEVIVGLARGVWSREQPSSSRVTVPLPPYNLAGDAAVSADVQSDMEFANETLRVWQERLGFLYWNIRVELVPRSALRPGTLGSVEWGFPGPALILVLNAAAYDQTACSFRADMEETIVHELVHLHLAFEPRMQKRGQAEEAIVNQISEALLQLDRVHCFSPAAVTLQSGAGSDWRYNLRRSHARASLHIPPSSSKLWIRVVIRSARANFAALIRTQSIMPMAAGAAGTSLATIPEQQLERHFARSRVGGAWGIPVSTSGTRSSGPVSAARCSWPAADPMTAGSSRSLMHWCKEGSWTRRALRQPKRRSTAFVQIAKITKVAVPAYSVAA